MNNRKFRFQFSLRLMLLMMAFIAVSAFSYLKMRRIQIPVPTLLQTNGSYPPISFIFETQNPFTAASVRQTYAADELERKRYQEADAGELLWISPELHQREIAKLKWKSFEKSVQKSPEDLQFETAIQLAESGDYSTISELVKRYSSPESKFQERLVSFARLLPADAICQSEPLIQFLKDRISPSDPSSGLEEARILHDSGFDSQPLIAICKWEIENRDSYYKKLALNRLLKIAPVEESFQLALEIFEDPENQSNRRLACDNLITTLLGIDEFAKVAGGKYKTRLVNAAIGIAEKDRSRNDDYFVKIASHDGPEFIEFMRSTASKPADRHRRNWALSKLEDFGEKGESVRVLESIVANDTFPADVMSHWINLKGKDAVCLELAKRLETNKSFPMVEKMCKFAEGENRNVAKSICIDVAEELFDESSPYFEKYKLIDYLADFEYEGVDALRKRVPVIENVWREGQPATDEFVAWVNNNLDPITPIDAASVFKAKRESGEEYGNFDSYYFGISAMEAAGRVVYLDPECFKFDSEFFAKIATIGGEQFQIEAHDCIDLNVRLLTNGHTYSFQVDDSRAWYDVVGSCEMLNLILERQNVEQRFFVFSEPHGNSYMLYALFAKPKVAQELVEKFKYKSQLFVKGCENYWK